MCAFANPLEIDNHNKTEAGAIMEVRLGLGFYDDEEQEDDDVDKNDGDEDGDDDEEEEKSEEDGDDHNGINVSYHSGKILEEKDGNDIGRIQKVEDILQKPKRCSTATHLQ